MGQRFSKIIVALLLVLLGTATYGHAQTKSSVIKRRLSLPEFGHLSTSLIVTKQSIPIAPIPFRSPITNARPMSVPANLYTRQLGFVCKKELQVQKATRVPVFFRLGSLSYCNYLEAKE